VRALWAAAALLALALGWVGGFFTGRASRTPVPDSAVNVAVAELPPVGEGARAAATVVDLPSGSEELLLALALPEEGEFPDYSAEILNEAGARVWNRQGLRPTPLGTLHLAFRRGALAPGVYRVRIEGPEGPVAIYELRLVEE
jgi:hypothetical protein